ncbi:hypothetical protein EJ08DRAFT_494345 [Tothia fuscella]|uniref:Uncharacterized protein n=1 Tax=Tothia fuscella TaxID=1048955 RepID=A0A9P4NZK7_9PEZI|nr:hypothetical protein EJ08DRAFT_494345 [Tothia fuscella]
MLDSNLPTYYYKPSVDKTRPYESSLLFTQFDSDPEPRYTLRHPDTTSPTAKNCYAVGLFDAYIPDVLFGEVLVKPEWTQPSLSQDEIRRNGGVPPRPLPVMPSDFTIQLYSPDSQIVVTEKAASWGGTPTYTFTMPQYTFRTPSASTLDRGTNDPAVDPSTPQIKFVWKRDGKFAKDISCFMTGKTTDTQKKKKGGKEPDIAVAIFSGFKDLTIYESNMHRVEVEDYKGLEVVLLLGAAVIRDIYCGQKKDCFNIGEAARKNSGAIMKRKQSMPLLSMGGTSQNPDVLHSNGRPVQDQRQQSMSLQRTTTQPPPPDPRAQWELEKETARLRQQAEQEKRAEDVRRRERQKREEEEQRRIRKMLEGEEKAQRQRQAEVDKETERLRKKYGNQSNSWSGPNATRRQSVPAQGHSNSLPFRPGLVQQRPSMQSPRPQTTRPIAAPYLQPKSYGYGPPAASQSSFFHSGGPTQQSQPQQRPKPKKSFFGLRTQSETAPSSKRVTKQKSTMF